MYLLGPSRPRRRIAHLVGVQDHQVRVARLLAETRRLLTDPAAWTRFVRARDVNNREVSPRSPAAQSYCLLGAIDHAQHYLGLSRRDRKHAIGTLRRWIAAHNAHRGVVRFNDYSAGHAEVLRTLDGVVDELTSLNSALARTTTTR
jgi:hypothetical protein